MRETTQGTDRRSHWSFLLLLAVLASHCAEAGDSPPDESARPEQEIAVCDTAAAHTVATEFGTRLQRVSLLAPDSVFDRALTTAYEPLVTRELLEQWLSSTAEAPGRETSSPWPARIEIDSVAARADGSCLVAGEVIYLTSAEKSAAGASAGAADRRPITLEIVRDGDWRIAAVGLGTSAADASTGSEEAAASSIPGLEDPFGSRPGEVIRRYYAAIDDGDYARAYGLWGDEGRSSGQSLDDFASGFAATEEVVVEVGAPGRVEGAAGSRFVQVPVVVRARLDHGEEQRFEGSYTLRRTVVDGSTAAERRWHIFSADIGEVR